ncbi:glycosyltransferase [Fusibacter bizertensis]|uniref:Glycosyltransferase n=1 Tax=Fusibacter bizertensis TaxID=1488331 RepID=A0ABT6NDS7_9FIRM|nr:glycosyltransferase [Fusibacter bizertensis]MDH8678585.1 glycosyltransferase [Fusibacter bizertensis]
MKLSVCMMVKNEEANLERCLNSLKNIRSKVSSELIIVDTGSTDRTIEIAKSFDAKVYEHKWNNNFSEMRNISISYCNGEWVMIIDADEELVDDTLLIKQLNQKNNDVNAIALELQNIINSNGKIGSKIVTMRLFRNDGKFHYKGVVHNLPVVYGNVIKIDALLNHYGYIADDAQLMEAKYQRTSKLLKQELEKDPKNIYYLYQLGTTYDMHNENDKAIELYNQAYTIIREDNSLYNEHFYLYGAYAKVLVYANRYEEAIKIANEGLLIKSDYIDLMYFGGLSNLILKKFPEGIELVKRYLSYIDKIVDSDIFNNPNVQLYTINSKTEVLVNLASAYITQRVYDESISITLKLLQDLDEESEYFEKCVNNYIVACVESSKFSLLDALYENISQNRWDNVDVMIYTILKNKIEINSDSRNHILSNLPTYLGKLFKWFYGSDRDNKTVELDINKNMYFINNGISEMILFLLETKNKSDEFFVFIDESTLMQHFGELIGENETQLRIMLLDYLEMVENGSTFNELYIKRIILKVIALNDFYSISEDNYFDKYINAGLDQLSYKYSELFLKNNTGKQYLNSEEQYFACLYNLSKNFDKYFVHYALEIFPQYSRKTLNWIEKNIVNDESNVNRETNELVAKIKTNIQVLIDSDKKEEAMNLINEYLEIYPNDIEMVLMKSEMMLLN